MATGPDSATSIVKVGMIMNLASAFAGIDVACIALMWDAFTGLR